MAPGHRLGRPARRREWLRPPGARARCDGSGPAARTASPRHSSEATGKVRGIDSVLAPGRSLESRPRGENVVVTTGTASGKSLAFNLPVLAVIAEEPNSARSTSIRRRRSPKTRSARSTMLKVKRVRPAIYDGDTRERRASRAGRTSSSPTRTCSTWASSPTTTAGATTSRTCVRRRRRGARYRGVFGSHVGNVLRRLRRGALYGSDPVFLLASATIGNPGELANRSSGSTSRSSERTERPRPSAPSRSRPASTRSSASVEARWAEASKLMADLSKRAAHARLREEPPRRR